MNEFFAVIGLVVCILLWFLFKKPKLSEQGKIIAQMLEEKDAWHGMPYNIHRHIGGNTLMFSTHLKEFTIDGYSIKLGFFEKRYLSKLAKPIIAGVEKDLNKQAFARVRLNITK